MGKHQERNLNPTNGEFLPQEEKMLIILTQKRRNGQMVLRILVYVLKILTEY